MAAMKPLRNPIRPTSPRRASMLFAMLALGGFGGTMLVAAAQKTGMQAHSANGSKPALAAQGKEIFRYDTFGDEQL